MLATSIIITMNIHSIKNDLQPPYSKKYNYNSPTTTTSAKDNEFIGLIQGDYDITYEEAKILLNKSTLYSIIVGVISITIPYIILLFKLLLLIFAYFPHMRLDI